MYKEGQVIYWKAKKYGDGKSREEARGYYIPACFWGMDEGVHFGRPVMVKIVAPCQGSYQLKVRNLTGPYTGQDYWIDVNKVVDLVPLKIEKSLINKMNKLFNLRLKSYDESD